MMKHSIAILLVGLILLVPIYTVSALDDAEGHELTHVGRYVTGYSSTDGGVAEIVAYNPNNQKFYVVNGIENKVDIVSLEDLKDEDGPTELELETRIDVTDMIEDFEVGDLTSVAVDTVNGRIAIAVQEEDYAKNGAILILDEDGEYLSHFACGVQPDMITFSPDGRYVLTADEGEPREGYGEDIVDPLGSVTVVDLDAETPEAVTVTFEAWDDKRDALVEQNVLLKKDLLPSADFEPECVAVNPDATFAYVALQEANAIAVLNLDTLEFDNIFALGFKDHREEGNELDVVKDKEIGIENRDLLGVYMPDGIDLVEIDGDLYLLTANEGDASEWGDDDNEYTNMTEIEIDGEEVEVMDKAKMDGFPEVEEDVNFILGGRSFAIFAIGEDSLELVFDSGSDFERITADRYPDFFNASNKNNKLDSRSDAKGPEPEDVVTCVIDERVYAYIGLERSGGLMVYDITNPEEASFVAYLNTRNFEIDFPEDDDELLDPEMGDISAEGLAVVQAEDSPTGHTLILIANEVSGTVAVYQHIAPTDE